GGDSGGPLFDMTGKVIGIHSRIAGPLTANIHVPVDTYRENWVRLVNAEDPYIGVVGDPESKDCKILEVGPGSPAGRAGLKGNDAVVRFDGRRISDFESLRAQVQLKRVGQRVDVEVLRGEETVNLQVVIGNRPNN